MKLKPFLNCNIPKLDKAPPQFYLDYKRDLDHNKTRAYRLLDEALAVIADSPEIHDKFIAADWSVKCRATELVAAGIGAEVLIVDS